MEQKLAVAATIRSNKQEDPPAAAGEQIQIVKSIEGAIYVPHKILDTKYQRRPKYGSK